MVMISRYRGDGTQTHQGVYTLSLPNIEVTGHHEAPRTVGRIEEIARRARVGDRRNTLVVVRDLEALSVVGYGGPAVGKRVPRVPGDRETIALWRGENRLVVRGDIGWDGVGGQTGVDVNADGGALLPISLRLVQIF